MLSQATVDARSFTRPVARCDPAECQGQCCYDGAELRGEEAETVPALAREHAAFFADLGLDLPDEVVTVDTGLQGRRTMNTATRPTSHRTITSFDNRLPDTACVFLTDDRRCGLIVDADVS